MQRRERRVERGVQDARREGVAECEDADGGRERGRGAQERADACCPRRAAQSERAEEVLLASASQARVRERACAQSGVVVVQEVDDAVEELLREREDEHGRVASSRSQVRD
jgi:hypothetical protein